MEVKIEELKMSDMKQAVKMLHKFISISPNFKEYELSDKKILKTVCNCILSNDQCIFAAKDGDRIVGLIGGYISSSWFMDQLTLREYGLFVDDDYRGKGLGFKLLLEWFKWGRINFKISDCWMCLNTGIDSERALKRFKKIGFKKTGTWLKFDYKEN